MIRRRSSRSLLTLAAFALVGASLAGCLGGPEEATDTTEADGLPTGERESDVVTPAVGCTDPGDAPAGHGSTGSVQDDEVGTGFGDIGSPTSCIDNPENGTAQPDQQQQPAEEGPQTPTDPQELPSSQNAEPVPPGE